MPSPEYEPKTVLPEFSPENIDVSESLQKEGVRSRPTHPVSIKNSSGQIVAQSSDPNDDNQNAIVIPIGEEVAGKGAHGKPEYAKTWYSRFYLRQIAIALHNGIKVIVGKS